jgi:hypothetical protein
MLSAVVLSLPTALFSPEGPAIAEQVTDCPVALSLLLVLTFFYVSFLIFFETASRPLQSKLGIDVLNIEQE